MRSEITVFGGVASDFGEVTDTDATGELTGVICAWPEGCGLCRSGRVAEMFAASEDFTGAARLHATKNTTSTSPIAALPHGTRIINIYRFHANRLRERKAANFRPVSDPHPAAHALNKKPAGSPHHQAFADAAMRLVVAPRIVVT